jgi:hypothetical protein
MAIVFRLDAQRHLVRTTYTGAITLTELVGYARALAAQGLVAVPQLIDARRAVLTVSPAETRELSDLMASLRAGRGPAQVAFVAGDADSYYIAESYAELGAGENPGYRIFDDVGAAELWIRLSTPSA